MSFEQLALDTRLLKAINACGFETPSEIQAEAIPPALSQCDLMASAPTGTGKTAAFVLPTLQRLLQPSEMQGNGPRVIILTPTRELAGQVVNNVRELGRYTRLRSELIVGGVPYPPQIKALQRPIDLLIATPGRLIDHMNSGRVDFSRVELLILDEADRMLDMGFLDDVKRVASEVPASRQTLLFSATLEGEIEKVARQILKDPVRIQVAGVKQKHEAIEQYMHHADDFKHKLSLLNYSLRDTDVDQAIIFTATKRGADDMATRLREQGHRVAALHGDMRMGQRRRVVDLLKRNKIKMLVATDVAARGLDVKGITHVINFDLPMAAEDYIHRIGRTGRGGSQGTALSLVGPNDWDHLRRIEKMTGSSLERRVVEGMEPQTDEPRSAKPGRGRKGNYRGNGNKRFNSHPRSANNRSNKQGHGNGARNTSGHHVKVTYTKSHSKRANGHQGEAA